MLNTDVIIATLLQVMYLDQRKERVELLKELLEKGTGMDPLPVLTQVTVYIYLLFQVQIFYLLTNGRNRKD